MSIELADVQGLFARGYGELLWRYLILNRKPHTAWADVAAPVAALPTER